MWRFATPRKCTPWKYCVNHDRTLYLLTGKRCKLRVLRAPAEWRTWTPAQTHAGAELEGNVNAVCSELVGIIRESDEDKAWEMVQELDDARIALLDESQPEVVNFLVNLQSLLNHQIHKDSIHLTGLYKDAFNNLCTAAQESGWNLNRDDAPYRSSTTAQYTDNQSSSGAKEQEQQQHVSQATVVRKHYRTLGVSSDASAATIKAAFRSLALKWHPDVNADAQAHDRFLEISAAYDVLSDEESRRMYDMHGEEGMVRHSSSGTAGRGNASRFWDEFKPHKRQNKSTRARDASRQASSADGADGDCTVPGSTALGHQALVGNVVEYPLSSNVQEQLRDGRQRGVALLVGRNLDRADAARLPPELLDLCELEPLRQQHRGSQRWVSDELMPPTFCRLGELVAVPVAHFDHRFDSWLIQVPLSPGCGGPDLPDEIIV